MYTLFRIKNFRCFSELTLSGLERVNLIAGRNNVGKTALLEALFIHCGAYNPNLTLKVNAFRGIEVFEVRHEPWAETPWDSIFYQFDHTQVIELFGKNTKTGSRLIKLKVLRGEADLKKISQVISYVSKKNEIEIENRKKDPKELVTVSEVAQILELEYKEGEKVGFYRMIFEPGRPPRIEPILPPPPSPAFFQPARMRFSNREEAELFSKLETYNKQEILLESLKIIEPRLKKLTIVVIGGEPILHGDIGIGRLVPLPVMGEGMCRITSLILRIANAPGGVVLIDEIENGLHYSVLSKVWEAIGKAARDFKTQVFATTHSLECIIAAHEAFSKSEEYDFRLHRLDWINGKIHASEKCMIYELFLYHLIENEDELKEIYNNCKNGELKCGDCKKLATQILNSMLKEIRERKGSKDEIKKIIAN